MIQAHAMNRVTFAIAAAFLCGTVTATPQVPVTFESPCDCRDNHGKGRWSVKNDPSTPPTDASTIKAVTPSDVLSWPGPVAQLTWQSERTGIEKNSFALTGRVVAVKAEADGDLHIALMDATGDKPGVVVCEVPAKPQWCEIRKVVFSWTRTRLPLHIRSTRKLTLNQAPIITVVGKAFWDIGHAPKDQSNRSAQKRWDASNKWPRSGQVKKVCGYSESAFTQRNCLYFSCLN